jgi:hypothetical protein
MNMWLATPSLSQRTEPSEATERKITQMKRFSFTGRGRVRLSVAGAIGVALLLPVAAAATASASATPHATSSSAAWVRHEVKGLLAHNRGSHQVSRNSIRTRDGAVITARPNTVSGRCQNGYTCLFWDSDFDGDQLTLGPYNDCYFYDLHDYYGSNGRTWVNEASSIDNPNPRPGPALFYHSGSKIYSLGAGHYLRNLTKDKASNGHALNDYIDFVWSC